jgi:hypothetical protein
MREIVVYLLQNLGTAAPGTQIAMASGVIEDLADLSQEVDGGEKGLVKVARGEVTLKVVDPDGSIWAYIESQLTMVPGISSWQPGIDYPAGAAVMANGGAYVATLAGRSATSGSGPSGVGTAITDGTVVWRYTQASGLLPPWIEVYVGGERVFYGLVDPARLARSQAADEDAIEIGANDWTMTLSDVYLGTPTASPWVPSTTYLAGQQVINGGSTYVCTGGGVSATSGGPTGIGTGITDGTVTWAFVAPSWRRVIPPHAYNGDVPDPQPGWSYDNEPLQRGYYRSYAFITNPCLAFTTGSIVTMSRPILQYRANSWSPQYSDSEGYQRLVGLGTWEDADGQTWTYQVVGTRGGDDLYGWVLTTAFSQPSDSPRMTLPNANFPAGMIVRCPAGDYQVSADGATWGTVYDTSYNSPYFTVLDVNRSNGLYYAHGTNPGATQVLLSTPPWPEISRAPGQWLANFTLYGATLEDVTYWVVTVAVPDNPSPEVHQIALDSVDGIVVGDKLATTGTDSSQSWTVAGVDPTLTAVQTVESVSDLPLNSHLYWDSTSQEELVGEDPRTILARAAQPYSVDLSEFRAPDTLDPVFGLLGAPRAIGDVWATLDGLKISQAGRWGITQVACQSWTGNPVAGWTLTSETTYQPTADWTSQLLSAPLFLMPYSPTNPFQRLRNRAYSDVQYRQENNGLILLNGHFVNALYVRTVSSGVYEYTEGGVTYTTGGGANFTPWSPSGAHLAGVMTVYDYSLDQWGNPKMRELRVNGSSIQIYTWSSATASSLTGTWTVSGGRLVQSIVPAIDQVGLNLYVIYTVDGSGTNDRLELAGFSGTNTYDVTTTLAVPVALRGGTLVCTPYAVYLVGASAIAQVTYSGGTLVLTTQYFVDQISCFFANTLVARTSSEFVIFGRHDTKDSSGSVTTVTRVLRVATDLTASLSGSLFLAEQVAQGAPTVIGATRDPSRPGRIVGHYGGSLWQMDTRVPMALGRFTPSGLDAMSLIEHVCQLYSAMAIPEPTGVLRIVSRVNDSDVVALTVPKVSVRSTRSWDQFASRVRVSVGDLFADAWGQQGGKKMEVSEHPLVSTLSGCIALGQGFAAWFGQPRPMSEEEWTALDLDTAAAWESVPMFARVSINGGQPVRLMSRSINYVTGSTTVKTVGA